MDNKMIWVKPAEICVTLCLLLQGASAALADARRHAARAGHRYRRSRDAAFNERRWVFYLGPVFKSMYSKVIPSSLV